MTAYRAYPEVTFLFGKRPSVQQVQAADKILKRGNHPAPSGKSRHSAEILAACAPGLLALHGVEEQQEDNSNG